MAEKLAVVTIDIKYFLKLETFIKESALFNNFRVYNAFPFYNRTSFLSQASTDPIMSSVLRDKTILNGDVREKIFKLF